MKLIIYVSLPSGTCDQHRDVIIDVNNGSLMVTDKKRDLPIKIYAPHAWSSIDLDYEE